jgi:hypothetical protein
LRNCNSTRPSCARRRRRSASVIGCGRPAWSHRMHSSFVRVGFSFSFTPTQADTDAARPAFTP